MIKRRFYKLEHGDRDAPSESSSSSDSEFEAEATEDEDEEEEQDDNDTKEEHDGVTRLTGGNESSSGAFNLMIFCCTLSVVFAVSLLIRGYFKKWEFSKAFL